METNEDRCEHFAALERDSTEDESAEIKRLMDTATAEQRDRLAARWPLEYAEWSEDMERDGRSAFRGGV